MRCRKTWILGAALCGALLCGANSQAGSITFLATETFTSSGTSVYTSPDGTTSVTYLSLPPLPTTTPSNVSLGTLTTSSTSATPVTVSDTFALTVTNIATLDTITFSGTLSGAIDSSTSSANLLFSSPLVQILDGYTFTIVSADSSTPGRLNLNAPTTNGGVSSINATVTSVPEPASVALLGLAVPALAALAYRRTRR